MATDALALLQQNIETIRREAYETGFADAMRTVLDFTNGVQGSRASAIASPQAASTADPTHPADPPEPTSSKPRQPRQARRASGGAPLGSSPRGVAQGASLAKAANGKSTTPRARRTNRRDNAERVAEVMLTLPDHSGRGADIRRALVQQGSDVSYSSIRNALEQLLARGQATLDAKVWTYRGVKQPAI